MIIVAPRFLRIIELTFNMNMKIGGLAILPFIFVPDQDSKSNEVLINHEKIHLQQQKELLFIGFVVWYFIALYRKGYYNVSFEIEAYTNQSNLTYLKHRSWFSFYKYR